MNTMQFYNILKNMLVLLVVFIMGSGYVTAQEEIRDISFRLPLHIKPVRYNLRLEPNFETTTFNGSVILEFRVLENSHNITLHVNQLNISQSDVRISSANGSNIEVDTIIREPSIHFFIIKTSKLLTNGSSYNLTIGSFTGALKLDNSGFYLAKYYDEDGNERLFATTQFQSIGARKAFPCLDEPYFKAKFQVQLVRKRNYTALTNENLLTTRYLGNDTYEDTFNETIILPSYLVAFIVSEYKSTERVKAQRVFADEFSIRRGDAEYALNTGIAVIHAGAEYLGSNYTLNKLDQVAIPDNHFGPGAMENWGLVTYRKSYIVYPLVNATSSDLQRTVNIIAHEYAHHWFGNLVTCSWWKYVWLNEGFANYFESYLASLVKPEWRLMDVFVLTSLQRALYSDSLNATKPMNSETGFPGGGPPSYIAYQKSGSVIRMMNHFLTERVFNAGLRSYHSKNLLGSVNPNNLYDELQLAVDRFNSSSLLGGYNVTSILSTWDSLEGYPLVTLKRNYTTGIIELNQKRFRLKNDSKIDNSTWFIPINFLSSSKNSSYSNTSQTTADLWLTNRKQILINSSLPTNDWVIVNKLQSGYYRVNYDIINWRQIINHLISREIVDIPILNRAQLLDDSFNLARSGQLNYDVPLNLSTYLATENDYIPFNTFFSSIKFLNTMLTFTKEYDIFLDYINNVLKHVAGYLGFGERENEPHLDKLNRIEVFNNLCKAKSQRCLNESLSILRLVRQNNTNLISPNLEAQIMCGAMRAGQYEDWEYLFHKYNSTESPPHRSRILNALGCSEDSVILNTFLNLTLSRGSIRNNDIASAFSAVYGNSKIGLITAFEFVKLNFETLSNITQLEKIMSDIGSLLTTEQQLQELVQLKNQHPNHEKMLNTAIENTKENIEWSNLYIDSIIQWLNDYTNS